MAKRTTTKRKAKSAFTKQLANIGDLWGKAKEQAGSGQFIEEPMSGEFRLTNAEIATIGENDWLHGAFEFTCLSDGPHQGGVHINRCGLESEESLMFLARLLVKLGVDVEDTDIESAEDLEALLKELVEDGPCVRAKLVDNPKNDFLNMRVQAAIDPDDDHEGDSEAEEEVGGGDEEPEEPEESEEDDEPAEEGDTISWVYRKKKRTGVVYKVLKNGNVRVEDEEDNKKKLIDADEYEVIERAEEPEEPEEPEETEGSGDDDDDTVEVEKGMKVAVEVGGKEVTGKITRLIGDTKVKVRLDKNKALKTFPVEEIEILEG